MTVLKIKQITCISCGKCVLLCPTNHLRMIEGEIVASDHPDHPCIKCGHCMASCASESIIVEGFDYADFKDIPEKIPSGSELLDLLKHRRSIRQFRTRDVEREKIERIIAAAATVPMVSPPLKIEVVAFTSKDSIAPLLAPTVDIIREWLPDSGSNERGFNESGFNEGGSNGSSSKESSSKESSSKESSSNKGGMPPSAMWDVLRHFVHDGSTKKFDEELASQIRRILAKWDDGVNGLTHDAPSMLLFHCAGNENFAREISWLAVAYAMLACESEELGSCIIGPIPPAINKSDELKRIAEIPDGNIATACLVMGYPSENYHKTIPRVFKSVKWR